ncbi:MAG TPA: PKD domain-containing protein [Vitreimonas sp.]|nr:PKD domain-containing protein [Vitreimonas sp.]
MKHLLLILGIITLSPLSLITPTAAHAQTNTCAEHQPVDTQFRSGTEHWVNGSQITAQGLRPNSSIDINCFAKNGYAHLPNAVIDVTFPNGSTQRVSSAPQLHGYQLTQVGTYTFRCSSTTINDCGNTDTLTVQPFSSSAPASSPQASPSPSPSPSASPTTTHRSTCDDLTVAGGNNSLVPAKVTLRARASDNKGSIQRYKFYFGDGKQEESDNAEIQHTYESSGSFVARVDVKDSQGNWRTSSSCEENVTVKASSVESHKSGCSDLYITANNNAQAPATLSFRVTGHDNKGGLQRYKLDFGNGVVKESDGQTFEQHFDKAGTYTARAYVKDSHGNWHGGEDNCKKTVYLSTKSLTRQPSTGTPTQFSLFGGMSGVLAVGLAYWKKDTLAALVKA